MIEWVVAPLAVLVAFWGPGLLVLRLGGARSHAMDLVAVAPAITVGICALAAEAAHALRVPWGLSAAGLVTAVVGLVAAVLRRRIAGSTATAERRPRRDAPMLLAAVTAAVGVQLAVVLGAMRDPRLLLAANDAGGHMTMVRGVIETGQASALTLTGAHEMDGVARTFYPAGWHAVAALAAAVGGVGATFTWAWLLPAVIAWTCGIVALTRAAFPCRPAILPWVALMSGPGVALPLTLTLGPEGMVPNTIGAALVPGVLALLVSGARSGSGRPSHRTAGVLGVLGLGAVHPNAALSLALLGAGWWVPALGRRARAQWRAGGRRRTALLGAGATVALAATGAAVAVAHVSQIRLILATHDEGALPGALAGWGLVTLDATFMTVGCGFVLFVAAIAGIVIVWRRRGRPMAAGTVIMAAFFLAASSSFPVLAALDAPWYDESRRYAPVIVAAFLPLSAYGAHAGVRWLAAHSRPDVRGIVRTGLPLVALLAVLVPGSVTLWSVAARSYHSVAGTTVVADESEMSLLERLPHELSGAAVLSGPFSGGSYLYALSGYPSVPRDWATTPTPTLRDLVSRLPSLGSDPRVCQDLDALGIRYLYIDPKPWQLWKALPLDRVLAAPPASGVRLIDQAGGARVYEITACG